MNLRSFTMTGLPFGLLLAAGGFDCGNAHVLGDSAVRDTDSGVWGGMADGGLAPDGGVAAPDAGLAAPDAGLIDAGPAADAAVPGGGGDGVGCGDEICLGGDECLYEADWRTTGVAPRCVPPEFRRGPAYEIREGWVILGCDGPEDCTAGQICAVWPGSYGFWTACSDTAIVGEQLCHSSADCPPSASECRPGDYYLPAVYGVCQTSGT